MSLLRYNDKFRREPPTKALEPQQDDRSGGDAHKDVQGEAIAKYSWSEGKYAVNILPPA